MSNHAAAVAGSSLPRLPPSRGGDTSPAALPEAPWASVSASSTTERRPRSASWYATLAPITPPPTTMTSIWSPAIDEQVPGIKQHFALAAEKGVVSDVPILAFLGKVFGGADAPLAAPEAVAELLAK